MWLCHVERSHFSTWYVGKQFLPLSEREVVPPPHAIQVTVLTSKLSGSLGKLLCS